jgi:glycosyltransferase involved in cell wall biosynthesis
MSARDRVVGVWTQWPIPFPWEAEGLTRLIGFLIEGAAVRGGVRFVIVAPAAQLPHARAAFSKLAAKEGVHWTLHALDGETGEVPGTAMRIVLPLLALLTIPAQVVRALWRVVSYPFNGVGFGAIPGQWRLVLRGFRRPVETASELGARLAKLPFGPELLGGWLLRWSERYPMEDATADAIEDEQDRAPEIRRPPPEADGWLLLCPDFDGGLALPGRRVTLLADAVPLDFPVGFADGWSADGVWTEWKRKAAGVLQETEGVITFSHHVARRHGAGTFGVPAARIAVIPHAPPDLAPALPCLSGDRIRTAASRGQAAETLRRVARARDWTYLIDFPFEDIDYIALSTAPRPNKNVPIVVRAVERLIRREFRNCKLFATCGFDPENEDDPLLAVMRETQLDLDFQSLRPLLPDAHACFLHAAAVTVHPSLSEGGTFPFQFAESVSVGTPCLIGDGPHVREFLSEYPEAAPWVFDPYDVEALVALIGATIDNRAAVLAAQLAVYRRLRQRTWADVAVEYAAFVTQGGSPEDRPHG